MKIVVKRGITAQCDAITPDSGEPLYDETLDQLRVGDGTTLGGDKVVMVGLGNSQTFMVNAFICPAPGTDWTPQLEGVGLAQSLITKKCWLPLNFLKIGDVITSYKLVGDATEAAALTLDCKLVQINKADPLTTTDITNGGMTQVTANGNFDVAVNPDDTTVAADKQYALELLGTTGVGDSIIVIGAEVVITRLP
uniref:Major tropism determinant N-terminal domain-containing protein n=1 Tax=viral metagenome TaxID=1070528 RepID=A0A6M3KJJ2_9ZZZZ